MITRASTTLALREALYQKVACSAEELRDTVGQIFVTTVDGLPWTAKPGPMDRSVHDPIARTMVLLADRIPAGQEAAAIAQEIARHYGREAAQVVLGERADELLSGDGKYAVGEWNHLFGVGRQETRCRIVVDLEQSKLIAAQEWTGLKFVDIQGDRLKDLAESVIEVNDAQINLDDWAGELVNAMPDWVDQRGMLIQAVPLATVAAVNGIHPPDEGAMDKGLSLRVKALALLQEAQAVDGLKPFTVTHIHANGEATYLVWASETPTKEQAAACLDSEFEPVRDERLAIEDSFSLEEMSGVALRARLHDVLDSDCQTDQGSSPSP